MAEEKWLGSVFFMSSSQRVLTAQENKKHVETKEGIVQKYKMKEIGKQTCYCNQNSLAHYCSELIWIL